MRLNFGMKKLLSNYAQRIDSEVDALSKYNYLKTEAIFGRKNISADVIKETNTELNKDRAT